MVAFTLCLFSPFSILERDQFPSCTGKMRTTDRPAVRHASCDTNATAKTNQHAASYGIPRCLGPGTRQGWCHVMHSEAAERFRHFRYDFCGCLGPAEVETVRRGAGLWLLGAQDAAARLDFYITLHFDCKTPRHALSKQSAIVMNKSPGDVFGAWRRLARQLQQAQQQAQQQANRGARSNLRYASGSGGGGSSGGGSGRGPSPLAAAGGAGLLLALVGGAVVVNSAIYNVDGGHRAIKYSRFFGVMPDVYAEGTHMRVSPQLVRTDL